MMNIKLNCKERDRHKYILNSIIKLKENNFIDCGIDSHIKINDMICIQFPDLEDEYYCKLNYSIFDFFEQGVQLYIYIYILSYGNKGVTLSDSLWTTKTKLSKNTVRKYINEMTKECPYRIVKLYGIYNPSDQKHSISKYYIYKKENKTNNINQHRKDQTNTIEGLKHGWYDMNRLPDENDYYVYIVTKDKEVRKQAEWRMNALGKSKEAKEKIMTELNKAKSKLYEDD